MTLRPWGRAGRAGGTVLFLLVPVVVSAVVWARPVGPSGPPGTAGTAAAGTESAGTESAGTASAGTAKPTAKPAACLGYNGLDGLNPAEQVLAGRFRTPGTAAFKVANGTDVNWGLDPYRDRTWQLWLHSLEWLGGLIGEYGRTRDHRVLDTATGIIKDWLADNQSRARSFGQERREAIEEGTKFRLITLVCLRVYHRAGWLDGAIARHAAWLARPANYSGPWNHGTDESMILLTAGCVIGRTDLADVGYRRLVDAVLRPPGGARPAIDAQGANNEQSTHYAVYNRARWRTAVRAMRACGRQVPAELERRLALMDEFIAFQTTPAGDLLQIGESHAAKVSRLGRPETGPLKYVVSSGREGSAPGARARVYEAGYVMGRSGWGRHRRPYGSEMAYTGRFGPGRYAHGQSDHMAVTFHALGHDILVPSGHIGYSEPQWQAWLRSPEAHNTLLVRDTGFRAGARTDLTAHRFRRGGDFFRLSDTAFTGTTRSRSVLAAWDPDVMVVLDEVRSSTPRVVEQLWHLPAAFTATPVPPVGNAAGAGTPGAGAGGTGEGAGGTGEGTGAGAVATAGPLRVHFLRVPLPGTTGLPATVVRGRLSPPQGWIVPSPRTTLPAPTVTLGGYGQGRIRMLTLIVPARAKEAPTVRTASLGGGALRVETVVSGHRLLFEATRDGTLRRLR